MNALPRVNLGSPLTELPVVDWISPNPVQVVNLVFLTDVSRDTSPACGDLNADALLGRRYADGLQPARQHDRSPASGRPDPASRTDLPRGALIA
jgi:hypothetical protein